MAQYLNYNNQTNEETLTKSCLNFFDGVLIELSESLSVSADDRGEMDLEVLCAVPENDESCMGLLPVSTVVSLDCCGS